ncbi:hypothetical protein [Paracoccus ravus]|uniref:hypothetical protein n=1 Tax=Paracoccus ravus TaxID=2447760 RepID=UPI00106E83ED|nr:hypothetical protein [Paracoccus ravus]
MEDPAYRDLSHRSFADLLNRRGLLTGWERPWTEVGVRRHRYEAEKLIHARAEFDREDVPGHDDVDNDPVAELGKLSTDAPVSKCAEGEDLSDEERELRKLPHYGIV